MKRKFEKPNEASGGMAVEKPLRGKVQNGLFHLAWKSAKPADSHFSTATAATDVFYPEGRRTEKPNPDLVREINLLQQKNGLDFGGRRRSAETTATDSNSWPRFTLS
jgi:hypothetical protein